MATADRPTRTPFAGPDPRRDRGGARRSSAAVAQPTPIETSRYLADVLGAPVHPQVREPAAHRLVQDPRRVQPACRKLTAEERARGVVAASAGNHAQGVAFAARELGIHATIFMPVGVAIPKFQATRAYGADVVLQRRHRRRDAARRRRLRRRDRCGAHPAVRPPGRRGRPGHARPRDPRRGPGCGDHRRPDRRRRTHLRCRERGQAARGARRARRSASSACRRPTPRPTRRRSRRASPPRSRSSRRSPTASRSAGRASLNFEIIRDAVDEVVTVSEDDIARAMLVLLERAKLVVEPAGAVGVAAILAGKVAADRARRSRSSPAATSTRC